MAKEKRSAADLDAELAALEAELAALEGKPRKKVEKPAKKEAPPPAPARAADAADAAEAAADVSEPERTGKEKKGRFSMPKVGVPKLGKSRKKEVAPEPSPQPPSSDATPAAAPTDVPLREPEDTPVAELALAPQKAFEPQPQYDLSLWRQEGDAWIRVVPETPLPVVRRILDENGNVLREERAEKRDVESVSSVRAERGLGRLLRRKG